MKQVELARQLAEQMNVDVATANAWITALTQTIYNNLEQGESVELANFGTFALCEEPKQKTLEAEYPNIAYWIAEQGWIRIGYDDWNENFVQAVEHGGIWWGGAYTYPCLESALRSRDAGIAKLRREYELG